MFQAARRRQDIAVALPATLTLDIPHLREKTARIGFISRTLALFRVEEAIIYNDLDTGAALNEARIIEKILKFQETPQYLRRDLFKVDRDLAFAGVLPPLRTPHHPDRSSPEPGMVRDAVVISTGRVSMVNAGFEQPVMVRSKLEAHARVTVRLRSVRGRPEGELVDPRRLAIYWGPKVHRADQTLGALVKRGNQDLTISTSRRGTDIRQVTPSLQARWRSSQRPLILFGSPSEGVPEILARTGNDISQADFNINTIPSQGVETVRTEEAVLATLAVLNLLEET